MAIDYLEFLAQRKTALIAPAGYGKTFTIVECLKNTEGLQLILTHTHAGVAALKERIKKNNIASTKYQIETITSFSQKYVLAYYTGNDIPDQRDGKNYYPFIIKKAAELVNITPISKIIKLSYSGLFVDEYQDCTEAQHHLVQTLSCLLKTRVLGDPLQGIFEFNGEKLVDMLDAEKMGDFLSNKNELEEPWRWKNDGNSDLGENIKDIRALLGQQKEINLLNYPAISIIKVTEANLYEQESQYRQLIYGLLRRNDNLLIIHPVSSSIFPRLALMKFFPGQFHLLESIDDQIFYEASLLLDNATAENIEKVTGDVARMLFKKTGVNEWFSENGLKNKRDANAKKIIEMLQRQFDSFKVSKKFYFIEAVLNMLEHKLGIRCYRKEFFYSICYALREASTENITVSDAMINSRNRIRRIGRKISGKCLGTTLLTKGLEFENVVILNAHKFDCPKHFYVAISRASKKLIIFTEKTTLCPYKD